MYIHTAQEFGSSHWFVRCSGPDLYLAKFTDIICLVHSDAYTQQGRGPETSLPSSGWGEHVR